VEQAAVLFVGTECGYVVTLNPTTGEPTHAPQHAHTGKVVSVLVGHGGDVVVTVASDMLVQVWAVEDTARAATTTTTTTMQGHLRALRSFYLPLEPVLAAITSQRVAAVCINPSTGRHAVLIVDSHTKECYRHDSSLDHCGLVSSITSSLALRCFATADKDGCVLLWDEKNTPILRLDLHDAVTSCCFLGYRGKGDLGVGIQGHFHRIPIADFLPAEHVDDDDSAAVVAGSNSGGADDIEDVIEPPIPLDDNGEHAPIPDGS
jgi:WD40 repeat protein